MKGRTYRYFQGEPLYPFGYGLSYTSFGYSRLDCPERAPANHDVAVSVGGAQYRETGGRRSGATLRQARRRAVARRLPADRAAGGRTKDGEVCPGARQLPKSGVAEIAVGGRQPGGSERGHIDDDAEYRALA